MSAPQMTEAYHKARRLLALFSGILIAWEYVGLRIGEQTGGPVTTKLPITETVVTIKNAEVIPVVVVILTIYFGFRLAIEWLQCDAQARTTLASKTDLQVAYFLASAAVLLFVLQRTTELRLADLLTPVVAKGLIQATFFCGIAVYLVSRTRRGTRKVGGTWRHEGVDISYFVRTPNMSFVSSLILSLVLSTVIITVNQFTAFLGGIVAGSSGLDAFIADALIAYDPVQPSWGARLISFYFGWPVFFITLWFVRKRVFPELSIQTKKKRNRHLEYR